MITVACACKKRFQTQDEHAGKKARCPSCGKMLVMPAPGDSNPGEKPGQPVPPDWWYPKGQAGASSNPEPPGPRSGEMRTIISAPPRDVPPPTAATPPVPAPRARWRWIASVAVGALLLVCLLLWVRSPEPAAGPSPKSNPAAEGGKSLTLDDGPLAGRPPAEGTTAVDTSTSPRPGNGPGSTPDPGSPASVESGQARLKLIVPAYFYPAGAGLKYWEQLIQAAARVPIVAVANPSSGPGDRPNPDYASVVSRAVKGGVVLIGYVGTNYARRPMAEVQADVDRWVRFYPEIRGIFFDAQASDAGQSDYYITLRDYVEKKVAGATVINNPGTVCVEEYASRLSSVSFCLFAAPAGFEGFRLPRWAERYPAARFAAMPNGVPGQERMRDYIQVATSRGFGLIYVTDAPTPNTWDRLPGYWTDEVEAVRRVNSGQSP